MASAVKKKKKRATNNLEVTAGENKNLTFV
jgi:hypothetical protein